MIVERLRVGCGSNENERSFLGKFLIEDFSMIDAGLKRKRIIW